MAQAKALITGMEVYVTEGPYVDHKAIVVNPNPVPDGQENQRKVLVALTDVFDGREGNRMQVYILPRQLDTRRLGDEVVPQYSPLIDQRGVALTTVEAGTLIEAEAITDPMDPALDRFRPDASLVRHYISRTIEGGYSDVEFLLALREQRDRRGYSPNVALVGETQSGKTMFVQVLAVLAAERDGMPKPYPVFTLSGSSGVTSYDIFGQTSAVIIDGKEVLVWMEGIAAMAARAGGFLYLDEWNAVPPSQAVALHPLLDDRRTFVNTQKAVPDGHGGFSPEVVQANTNLWVLSTINPGYKGTQTMAEATSNRFRWLSWDYDDETEKKLIPSKSVRLIGTRLREAVVARVLTVPIGTSVLQRFNADCALFGVDTALWSFASLFPPAERSRFEAIVVDGGMVDMLKEEYPEAQFKPGAAIETGQDVDTQELGSTWEV